MSGCTKYTDYVINPSVGTFDPTLGIVVLGSIIAARAAQAVIEEGRRLDAQERCLATAFKAQQTVYATELNAALTILNVSKVGLAPHDFSRLNFRASEHPIEFGPGYDIPRGLDSDG